MAARLKAAGFPKPISLWAERFPQRRIWWSVSTAAAGDKPILLLAHTDVVEAKREDWSMDPFQFIELDGLFYGRGPG